MVLPTRRLALLLAGAAPVAGLAAAPPGSPAWPVVAAVAATAVLVLGLVDALAAVPTSVLCVVRRLPPVVTVGGVAEIAWVVDNTGGRVGWVALADDLAPSLGAERRLDLVVEAGGRTIASTPVRPTRRGRFALEWLVVRSRGPLGLGVRQGRRRVPGDLRVLPASWTGRRRDLAVDRSQLVEQTLRSARGRGTGTEFDQLREYTPDDEYRRIDWSATARVGRPIVRTFRSEEHQNVVVLLDSGRVMAGRIDGVPRLEHAMDAALALAAATDRLRDRFGLVTFDQEVRRAVVPGRGVAHRALLVDTIYDLFPTLVESDYGAAITAVLARVRRRSLVVLLTDLVGETLKVGLEPLLPVLLAHHRVIVATAQDPRVTAWVGASPETAGDAHRAAAAVATLDDRRRVAARLAGTGVNVIDAPTGDLPRLLVDAYLELKARAGI